MKKIKFLNKNLLAILLLICFALTFGFIIEHCSNSNQTILYTTRNYWFKSKCENTELFYILWSFGGHSNKNIFHNCLFKKSAILTKYQIQTLDIILSNKNNFLFGFLGTCEINGCIISYGNFGKIDKIIYIECSNQQITNIQNNNIKTMLFSEDAFIKFTKLIEKR